MKSGCLGARGGGDLVGGGETGAGVPLDGSGEGQPSESEPLGAKSAWISLCGIKKV